MDGVILNPDLDPAYKESALMFWALLVLPLFLVGSLISLYRNIRTTRLNGLLAFDLRRRLFNLVLHLPLTTPASAGTRTIVTTAKVSPPGLVS